MKLYFRLLLLFPFLGISFSDKLKFVNVLYRHGDRAPTSLYPSDPHPASTWPNGLGQLTNPGKNHSYQLGKFLRDRYRDVLPLKYSEEDIRIMSSDKGRVLMSAYLVLAGLYEPLGDDVWSEWIHWQPIPVHSIPTSEDNILQNTAACPKFQKLLNNALASDSGILNRFEEVMRNLSQYANISLNNNPEDISIGSEIYDTLTLEEENGLELPEWTADFYPEPLLNISKYLFVITTYDQDMKRLRCGPLLKDMIQNFEKVMKKEVMEKMWQYAAHDQTIVDLLQCLNVFDGELVPFASAVFLELYNTNYGFEVLISYKKEDVVTELTLPGCSIRCPYGLFKELVSDVIPDDWDEECKLDSWYS